MTSITVPRYGPDETVATPAVPRPHGAMANGGVSPETSVVNWYLIAAGLIYIAWTWFHLPSSIWGRCIFVCYLVWRMKPDIIIPMMLAGVQLRLQIGDAEAWIQADDIALQLTGFEQYAFAVPCVLYAVRTFIAAFSARSARRETFPFQLYGLYLLGAPLVMAGAFWAHGERAWTTGVRNYCIISLYFYGLLLPACSLRQMARLARGFAVFGFVAVVLAMIAKFHSRQLWVLMPLAGSLAPLLFFRLAPLPAILVATLNSTVSLVYAATATFTILLQWLWGTAAGSLLGPMRSQAGRGRVAGWLVASLLVLCPGLTLYGAFFHDPSRDAFLTMRDSGATMDRVFFKLFSDRGPIWWGAMRAFVESPSLFGDPAPKFVIHSLGKDQVWPYSTHNIILDPLLRLGMVVGPIILIVLVHATFVARSAIGREPSVAVNALALMVISSILLGGITLPYVFNEREAEHLLMTAGLLGVFARQRTRQAFGGGPAASRAGEANF